MRAAQTFQNKPFKTGDSPTATLSHWGQRVHVSSPNVEGMVFQTFSNYNQHSCNPFIANEQVKLISFILEGVGFMLGIRYVLLIYTPSNILPSVSVSRIPAETWAASVTKVTQRGQCMHCGKQMASEKITPEQFAELRKDFLEKSLKREDIFLNTTPKELQRFHQFLNTQPPFDMVLDGLNIALQLSYNYKKNAAQQVGT